jgi:hypothetical protein
MIAASGCFRRYGGVFALGLLSVLSLSQAGCQDRLYPYGQTISLIDAGPGTGGTDGGARDRSQGSGGRADAGGLGGGAGGAGGVDAGGQGGAAPTCDDTSPERQTDILNCGSCSNQCKSLQSAAPTCTLGVCGFTCLPGAVDADGDPTNGCECTPTNNGVEVCDGIDNNCNGVVDEGFDLMSDLANCGGCNRPCYFPFASATCTGGVCTQGACLPGFYDRDPAVPGCETSCQLTNGGVEICDGLDNDCNGLVDTDDPGLQAPTITCKSKGVCANTAPKCMGAAGYTCTYPATHQDVEDTTLGCDGLDNDCDGQTDEAFDIGKSCIFGTGPCAGTGVWVCDSTQPGSHRCSGSLLPSSPEVCDGKDNNCDGHVDELNTLSSSNDGLVTFSTTATSPTCATPPCTVVMFAYEASRYDATSSNYGFDSTKRPCSLPGKLPWSNVTKEEAEAACEQISSGGWRLCTAAEWADACNGPMNTVFPYGASYSGTACNGFDYPKTAGVTTIPTGAAMLCISATSATPTAATDFYDMSGNVKEWTATTLAAAASPTATTPFVPATFELRGGAYDIASFINNGGTLPDGGVSPVTTAPGLQCDASTPAPAAAVRLPSVGFRCCHPGTLPP